MADKLSSPSASSNSGLSGNTSKGLHDEVRLVVRKQPPAFVFPGETFEFHFSVETAGRTSSANNSPLADFDVVPSLEAVGKSSAEQGSLVVLEGSACRLSQSQRTGNIQCQINMTEPSTSPQKTSFVLKLAAKGDSEILPVMTSTIRLVASKLRVTTPADWENVFFKDEGGRDKSMEVVVAAYDRENQVRREKIPLSITLCYYSAEVPVNVMNQDILKIQGNERKQYTDKSTGMARIRFRIEDVSKNHQGQDFVLKIAADRKTGQHIAPGYTPAISVRSKRNKRHRTSGSGGSGGSKRERSGTSPPPVIRTSGAYGDPSAPLEGFETGRVREAMQRLTNWTDEVVNGLYSLQWQVLGYAQHPDGTPDYSRPYHSMPNPNNLITQILSRYSESTRGDLRLLQHAIDQMARQRGELPYGDMASAALPEAMFSMVPPQQRVAAPGMTSLPPQLGPGQRPGGPPYQEYPLVASHPASYFPPSMPPRPPVQEPAPANVPTQASIPQAPQQVEQQGMDSKPEAESRESEVEYVLAKQYKSMRTSERLGMPAYSADKELLGFYRESSTKVGVGQFVPIQRLSEEFGPVEIQQATDILEESLATKSKVVHALKDWGSISNLMDHALVYDWSKDIGRSDNNSGDQADRTSPDIG